LFHGQNKTHKAFSVHNITEAKQSSRQGGARAVDLPARSFDLARPGVAPPLSLSGLAAVRCSLSVLLLLFSPSPPPFPSLFSCVFLHFHLIHHQQDIDHHHNVSPCCFRLPAPTAVSLVEVDRSSISTEKKQHY